VIHLNAIEYMILDALSRQNSYITAQRIESLIGEASATSVDTTTNVLLGLESQHAVHAVNFMPERGYRITQLGRQSLDAHKAVRTSANTSVDDETEPPTALLCVDEDELDAWWESLDVEQKADCFTQFALTQYTGERCHIYIEQKPAGIPITGTIGAEEQPQ